MMPGRPPSGRIMRLVLAGRYTLAGLGHALRTERPFQEKVLWLVVIVIPGTLCYGTNGVERALLIGS